MNILFKSSLLFCLLIGFSSLNAQTLEEKDGIAAIITIQNSNCFSDKSCLKKLKHDFIKSESIYYAKKIESNKILIISKKELSEFSSAIKIILNNTSHILTNVTEIQLSDFNLLQIPQYNGNIETTIERLRKWNNRIVNQEKIQTLVESLNEE